MSKVFYGISSYQKIDITIPAVEYCVHDQALIIPVGDVQRATLFRVDPYPGEIKTVYIESPEGIITDYDQMTPVDIPNFA